jgi:large subunit ribosomal protein L25
MKTITIEGQLRTEMGKKATRHLRAEGKVPGVIYGGAKEISFAADTIQFKDLVYTPNFQLAEVKLGGNVYTCILKDLQFNTVSDELQHVDFLELVEDKKVIATIPLKFTGAPAGVKDGGKLMTNMKGLKVKTLPKYLRENIEVNLSHLELNDSVRVEDVQVEHFEMLNSPRIPIASVVLTRELKQEETPAAAAVAAPGTTAAAPAAGAPAATPAPALAPAKPASAKK